MSESNGAPVSGRPRPARRSPVLDAFAREAVASGRVSAVVCAVSTGAVEPGAEFGAAGRGERGRAASWRTAFDWASLTKPCVATLALALDGRGRLPLRRRLGEVWPGMRALPGREWLAAATLEDLLRHRSGLPAWWPLERLGSPGRLEEFLLREVPRAPAPAPVYSDLGYLLWGLAAERALERSLDDLVAGLVLRPLGMRGTGFWTAARRTRARRFAGRAAPHSLDNRVERGLAERLGVGPLPERPAPAAGEPQDGNARFLDRPAGHAGLFGPLPDLLALGREWLAPSGRVLTRREVRHAWSGEAEYQLGWCRPTAAGSAGPALPPSSRGHTGFAGGSLWLDRRRRRIYAILACRTSGEDLNPWRRAFHELVT